MWNWRHFVALIVVFAAGFGAGLIVSAESGGDALEQPRSSANAEQDDVVTTPWAAPSGPPQTSASPATQDDLVSPANGLAAALRLIPYPDLEIGSGAIAGRVIDETGTPVAGAIVSLSEFDAEDTRPVNSIRTKTLLAETWTTLEDDVREMARAHLRTRHPERTKVTGSDGAFAFTGLVDCRYGLAFEHDDYRLLVRSGHGPFVPGDHVEVTALRAIKLTVHVYHPAGAEAAKCSTRVTGGASGTTQVSGRLVQPGVWRYLVAPGTYVVRATYSGKPARCETQLVTLSPDSPERTVVVKLEWVPTIEVEVVWSDGVPIGREELLLVHNAPGLTPDAVLFKQGRPLTAHNALTGGRIYRAEAMEPGSYLLGALQGNNLLRWERVEHTAPWTQVRLALDTPSEGSSISLVCKDETGAPFPAHSVGLLVGDRVANEALSVWRIAPGELRAVPQVPFEVLARRETTPTLHVSGYDGQLRKVQLDYWGPQRIEVRFARKAPVYLRLSGDTRGSRHLQYRVQELSGAQSTGASQGVEGADVVLLPNMPLGLLRISIERACELGTVVLATAECHVGDEGVITDVHLPPRCTITLVAEEKAENVVLTGTANGSTFELKPFSFQGQWRIQYLPQGTYTAKWVRTVGGEARTTTFRVDGDARVALN